MQIHMKKKRFVRLVFPPVIAIIAGLIISLLPLKNESSTWLKIIGLKLQVYAIIYIVIISILQFFIKKNYLLIAICISIITTILYLQFKIQHYPYQIPILIIGNSTSLIIALIGHVSNKQRK